MKEEKLKKLKVLLEEINEPHLKVGIENLTSSEIDYLYSKIKHLTSFFPKSKRESLLKTTDLPKTIEPFNNFKMVSIFDKCEEKKSLINMGKVAIVLLAGGQATRLSYDHPKGMFPISPLSNKTLFEIFFEKVKAASDYYKKSLQVAILVSPLNANETREYFEKNQYFGLKKSQIHFVQQNNFPFLDEAGNFLKSSPSEILEGPNGNGEIFLLLKEQGILDHFSRTSVESLQILSIDNPLPFPFDPIMAGEHEKGHDVVIKVCEKKDAKEKVGVLSLSQGKAYIIEYSEMGPELADKKKEDGKTLFYHLANTAIFSFSMDFAKKAAQHSLQFHKAFKKAKVLREDALVQEQTIIKLESFIFDHLSISQNPIALLYPREEIFSPLKQNEDIEKVKNSMDQLSKLILKKYYDIDCSEKYTEISPLVFYKHPERNKLIFKNTGFIEVL